MNKIILIKPSLEYEKEILEYRKEFQDRKESMDGCGILSKCETVSDWLDSLKDLEHIETAPKGYVTSETYLAMNEEKYLVGIIDLRHSIDHPILKEYGGHIGYSVRASKRNQGYAKNMLESVLNICKEKEMNTILITCLKSNTSSEKVILHNKGVYERTTIDFYSKEEINRYLIHLNALN